MNPTNLTYSPDAAGVQPPIYVTPTTPLPVGMVPSSANSVKVDRSVTAGLTNSVAVPANAARNGLILNNLDAANPVFYNLGAAATAGLGSLRIGPLGRETITCTNQALNIIAVTAPVAVTIWEF